MAKVRVGTCGFCMGQAEYGRTFDVVELQQTFYQPPRIETARRWRQQAPAGFEFTLKAFQAITHPPSSPTYRRSRLTEAERTGCGGFRDTAVVRRAWQETRAIARELDARVVVFQCPASFTPTDANVRQLRRFFEWADRGRLRFAWEPRGPAWTDQILRPLCGELELIHVLDPLQTNRGPALSTPVRYFRLHGIGGYRYRHTDDDLASLLKHCGGRTTYCLFNNLAMRDDALRFAGMLSWLRTKQD